MSIEEVMLIYVYMYIYKIYILQLLKKKSVYMYVHSYLYSWLPTVIDSGVNKKIREKWNISLPYSILIDVLN